MDSTSWLAVGRNPALLQQCRWHIVVVKGQSVIDHLRDIEQIWAFRNAPEEGLKHRPHQPPGDPHAARAEKVATLSDVRQFIDGNLVQQCAHPLTGFGFVGEYGIQHAIDSAVKHQPHEFRDKGWRIEQRPWQARKDLVHTLHDGPQGYPLY